MIPGPVAGRTPVDPGLAQRQLIEDSSEITDSGPSFADLLAAMLAPGAPAVPPQSAASAPAEAVFERLDAAEVFNETGLFRGAAPLPSSAGTEVAAAGEAVQAAATQTSAAAPVRAPVPNAQAELQVALSPPAGETLPASGAAITAADQIAADPGSAATTPIPISGAAYPAMPALHGQPVAAAGTASPGAEAGPEPAGSGPVSPRATAMVAQLVAAKAGATAAQVSVQAVEGGLSVVARVDKLSREERDRLRTEIGELLAGHGFGVAQIWLNGEAWPSPQERKD
jgi:hypothetical protein